MADQKSQILRLSLLRVLSGLPLNGTSSKYSMMFRLQIPLMVDSTRFSVEFSGLLHPFKYFFFFPDLPFLQLLPFALQAGPDRTYSCNIFLIRDFRFSSSCSFLATRLLLTPVFSLLTLEDPVQETLSFLPVSAQTPVNPPTCLPGFHCFFRRSLIFRDLVSTCLTSSLILPEIFLNSSSAS